MNSVAESEKRTVGERGQIALPKDLRERLDIHGGDEVLVHESDGRIEKPVTRAVLAEGCRRRAAASRDLAEEMDAASRRRTSTSGTHPTGNG